MWWACAVSSVFFFIIIYHTHKFGVQCPEGFAKNCFNEVIFYKSKFYFLNFLPRICKRHYQIMYSSDFLNNIPAIYIYIFIFLIFFMQHHTYLYIKQPVQWGNVSIKRSVWTWRWPFQWRNLNSCKLPGKPLYLFVPLVWLSMSLISWEEAVRGVLSSPPIH